MLYLTSKFTARLTDYFKTTKTEELNNEKHININITYHHFSSSIQFHCTRTLREKKHFQSDMVCIFKIIIIPLTKTNPQYTAGIGRYIWGGGGRANDQARDLSYGPWLCPDNKDVKENRPFILTKQAWLINNYSLKSRWIVAEYLPSREAAR